MVPQSTRNTDVLLHKFEVQKLKEEIQGLKIELDRLIRLDSYIGISLTNCLGE
jgi:hypothetical protein